MPAEQSEKAQMMWDFWSHSPEALHQVRDSVLRSRHS
ncbi:catalase [Pseudomonas sp. S11P7]|nr:catalase [Pseudomonas sp. S11P7]MCR8972771.1 catalase [Pseudomonas sp. S11P7]